MVKLGIFVMLYSIAIAMKVVCGIAESLKEGEQWFRDKISTNKAEQKVTKLHFYFQEFRGYTTDVVAQANSSATSPTFFGATFMMDDPLTVGPSQTSKETSTMEALSLFWPPTQ
ncbi:hypothetical protein HYC85_009490 [Camellia sinensis]|uniref:Dirigent protein n=1 Tax=Camellia sinensis TaxID=4442 RepID=A0A7J7HI01_CAMSI|nr:hypothetical protein HYC85_009490 [Camellia sinensis]